MSNWYDDENENTSEQNESFGFFGETPENTDVTTDEQVEEPQGKLSSFKERVGKKNFTLIIIMLVGMAIIIAVSLIFGADTSNKKDNQGKQQQATQQAQSTQQPVKQSTGYADWKDMTGATFTTGTEKTAQFTVTDYKLYARNTGGKVAPLEVRVEVWGALAGYDGLYKLDVPYATIAAIIDYETNKNEALSFPVTFKVGTYGENKVIYDITP